MKRWQYRLVFDCPCCGEMEDKAHITQCQQDLAAEIWDLAFKKAQTVVSSEQHMAQGGRCHFMVLIPVAWDCPGK